jgi:hypothetical protein
MEFPDPSRPIAAQTPEILHAMLVWGEARGEPTDGASAVAHVPLTRSKLSGNSLKDEILRPYAFSCFNYSDPNRHLLLDPAGHGGMGSWAIAWRLALEARGGQSANLAEGATHYVTKKLWGRPTTNPTYPKWFEHEVIESGSTKLVATLGSHVFATTPWRKHLA